jgi:hypothetical protein
VVRSSDYHTCHNALFLLAEHVDREHVIFFVPATSLSQSTPPCLGLKGFVVVVFVVFCFGKHMVQMQSCRHSQIRTSTHPYEHTHKPYSYECASERLSRLIFRFTKSSHACSKGYFRFPICCFCFSSQCSEASTLYF